MDVKRHLIVGDLLMGELSDQVTRDGTAELPAEPGRERLRIQKQLPAGDRGMFVEVSFAGGEGLFDVVLHLELGWIGADDECTSKVCFPLLENRTEVEEE